VSTATQMLTCGLGSVAPLMMPPYIHCGTSEARIAPTSRAAMYPGTRSQGKLPRTANAKLAIADRSLEPPEESRMFVGAQPTWCF